MASIRTTTSSPSSSSSVIRGELRSGVCNDFSRISCRSPGVIPARSRARRLTASGSRRGSTATFSTTLLGTMIESSPVANVVYSRPSELTVPSTVPASGPPCRRTRSPTRKGRALSRTVPAIRFPSVCCAARPKITAVNAPAQSERLRFDPRHRQRHEQRHDDRCEADQEAHRAGRGGIQATEQRRSETAPDVARDRPAEDHQRDHGQHRTSASSGSSSAVAGCPWLPDPPSRLTRFRRGRPRPRTAARTAAPPGVPA